MNLDANGHAAPGPDPAIASDAEQDYPLHERREHERVPTKDLLCLLGEVLDISEGGAMIHFRGRLTREVGDVFAAMLRHEQLCIAASMRIARIEKVGYRRYNLGIEFIDLTEWQRSELAEISAAASGAFIGPQAYVA